MPRVLQIDEKAVYAIAKVRQYALDHVVNERILTGIKTGFLRPVGDNPEHVVHLHDGYRVVYSVDEAEGEQYHHISLSYEYGIIGVPEVELILKQFMIADNIHDDIFNIWLEDVSNAVNILKKFIVKKEKE